jgi:hypothetical protein
MGEEVEQRAFTREDRTRHRAKVRRALDVFERMLRQSRFEDSNRTTGLEIELNLVDEAGDPALKNAEALEAIADPDFVTELGQFNLEINVPPRLLGGDGLTTYEDQVRASLNAAEEKASKVGAHLVMVGVLPTLQPGHMTGLHAVGEPAVLAAVGADSRRAGRGHRAAHLRSGASGVHRRQHRP